MFEYLKGYECEMKLERIIMFGAGTVGVVTAYMLMFAGIKVVTCFDNGIEKQGKKIWECILCQRPVMIEAEMPIVIAVLNENAKWEIEKQCRELGYVHILYVDTEKLKNQASLLPDKNFLELTYYVGTNGKILNLNSPKTFNEKIQWLKLYDRNPEYTKMVDKYKVKEYVAEHIGEKYIIPTLGVWERFEDINFDKLPEQFVLKCTHDSGSVSIIRDKYNFDYDAVREKYTHALQKNYYDAGREWPYKNVRPRIIAEELLQREDGCEIVDYKFMCFGGEVRCIFICTNRFEKSGLRVTFYDTNWRKMPFERHYPSESVPFEKPKSFNEMRMIAEKLSKGIPFVRIDFYEINERPLVGEITFYPGGGYEQFDPDIWDEILGSWIRI